MDDITMREDAKRWQYVVANSGWYRDMGDERDPPFAYLRVVVPYDSDLSCKAMVEYTIDKLIYAKTQTEK
jgi:hypothetical protein